MKGMERKEEDGIGEENREIREKTRGLIYKKILGKILSLAQVFPKFFLSLSKVIKLRFSQNFKFNSLLQY